MTKADHIRQRIFNTYSANLINICRIKKCQVGHEGEKGEFVEVNKPYICPICELIFQEESLNQNNTNPLTLEDVPPKKLGGKPIILTCKNCNNILGGTKLDSKLIWDLEIQPFMKREPKSRIKAYYEINKRTKVKGELEYIEDKKYGFHFNPKSNPNLEKELKHLEKNWDGSTIRFNVQAPNKRIVHLAILRLAYLTMISKFGYGYYFNDSAKIIRKQLLNPDNEIIQNFGIPEFNAVTPDKEGVHFIISPRKYQSFLVVFNVKSRDAKKTISVFIPGPTEECMNLYSDLTRLKKLQFDIVSYQTLNVLKKDRYPFVYNEIWRYHQKNDV